MERGKELDEIWKNKLLVRERGKRGKQQDNVGERKRPSSSTQRPLVQSHSIIRADKAWDGQYVSDTSEDRTATK